MSWPLDLQPPFGKACALTLALALGRDPRPASFSGKRKSRAAESRCWLSLGSAAGMASPAC